MLARADRACRRLRLDQLILQAAAAEHYRQQLAGAASPPASARIIERDGYRLPCSVGYEASACSGSDGPLFKGSGDEERAVDDG